MPQEPEPIFKEKSSPVQEALMNDSPEMDINEELARNAQREGRHSRVNGEKPR